MGLARNRLSVVVAVLALALAACAGAGEGAGPATELDDNPPSTEAPPPDESDDGGAQSDEGSGNSGSGASALEGAGTGAFTVNGESFDNVNVFACEPFSFGSQGPDPEDISLLAFLGGMSGLEVEVSHGQGFDLSDGGQTTFDQVSLNVYYSRQGDGGVEQFEGSASTTASGAWVVRDEATGEETELGEIPYVRDGDRVSGALAGLVQTWPEGGTETLDVTYDLEVPSEINEEC